MKKIDGNGHWEWPKKINPDEWYGFIYRVTFLLTGEKYIGKKGFHTWNKTGTKKTGSSNWRSYKTSSEEVAKLLEEYPLECFQFEILCLCKTKGSWSYAEANALHKFNALTEKDPVWGLRVYLNKAINEVRWIPNVEDGCITIIDELVKKENEAQE